MRNQLAALLLLASSAHADPPKPHVLLVIADDYGWNDIGYHQNQPSSANPQGLQTTDTAIQTPHLDRLAAQGRKLENYYVQPVCSPTRGTIMTGRYPSHTGIGPAVIQPPYPYAMPAAEVLLPQKFKEAGYQTAMVGKWHLGFCDERYTPTFRGFDSFTGYLLGAEDYWNHTRSSHGFHGLDFRNGSFAPSELPPACPAAAGTYSTELFVDAVGHVLASRRAEGPPLFMYMAFQSVHEPLQAPQSYVDPEGLSPCA